jgi:hypothetical protein
LDPCKGPLQRAPATTVQVAGSCNMVPQARAESMRWTAHAGNDDVAQAKGQLDSGHLMLSMIQDGTLAPYIAPVFAGVFPLRR